MADTAIAVTNMTFTNDVSSSGDFSSGSVGTSVGAGDVGVLTAPAGDTGNIVFTFFSTGGSSVTIAGGAEPPSENSGLGASSSITLTAGKPYFLRVRAGRFVQSNGTVRITNGGANAVIMGAYRQPLGS